MNEEEIKNYLDRLLMQKNIFSKVSGDPYEEEDAHEFNQLKSNIHGQIFALNKILGREVSIIKDKITFTMFGASDDLIELEGGVREEINNFSDDPLQFVLSDGTVGTIQYTDGGVWRINILDITPDVDVSIIEPTQKEIDDDTNYTDVATFVGKIDWIVFGNGKLIRC
jgi:hypothetical protein